MNELLALQYICAMWTLTANLFAGRVGESIGRAAHANILMCQGLLWEYRPRPCATVYQISDWRTA
jgi:hypothetical protein